MNSIFSMLGYGVEEEVKEPKEPKVIPDLPDSVLVCIFEYLTPNFHDILNCTRVCKKWRLIISKFTDQFWKDVWEEHYQYMEQSYKKSGLTWLDLTDSLSLWSEIANADVEVKTLPYSKVKNFQVVSNGTISFAEPIANETHFNTIVYFNLNTMKEKKDKMDVNFIDYKENYDIIVLVYQFYDSHRLMIIPKENRSKVFDRKIRIKTNWLLEGNEVFCNIDEDNISGFSRIRVIKNEGRIEFETTLFIPDDSGWWDARVLEVQYRVPKLDKLFMLCMYSPTDVHVVEVTIDSNMYTCELKNTNPSENYLIGLHKYNFDWTAPEILAVLTSDARYNAALKTPDIVAPKVISRYVIAGTRDSNPLTIDIYQNLYEPAGLPCLEESVIVKTIDLESVVSSEDFFPPSMCDNPRPVIDKIEVVEKYLGHYLVVLYASRILVVELSHRNEDIARRIIYF